MWKCPAGRKDLNKDSAHPNPNAHEGYDEKLKSSGTIGHNVMRQVKKVVSGAQ